MPRPSAKAPAGLKAAILADLRSGRAAVLAAARGLDDRSARMPWAAGKWSPQAIVAHLAGWDAWLLEQIPAAMENRRPAAIAEAEASAMNARFAEDQADRAWPATLAHYRGMREALVRTLSGLPALASMWSAEHALGYLVTGYAEHDRHHAEQIAEVRDRLKAGRRRGPPTFTPAFAAQRAHASEKQNVLFEFERARVSVQAALQGLSGGHVEQPIAEGRWSVRELVLHLVFWDQWALNALPFAIRGEKPEIAAEHLDEINAQGQLLYEGADWEEALRLLHTTREALRAELLAIPDEPADVWGGEHAIGWLVRYLPGHDRHHAAQIKAFRTRA